MSSVRRAYGVGVPNSMEQHLAVYIKVARVVLTIHAEWGIPLGS